MSFVGAVLHHTGRVTADTAGIRGGIYNVALSITVGELFQVRIQIQILQRRAFLMLAGIDVRLVGAVDDLPRFRPTTPPVLWVPVMLPEAEEL